MRLGWSKMAKQFSVNSHGKSLCQYQASRQVSTRPGVFLSKNFRYFPSFLSYYFSEIYCTFCFGPVGKCLMDSEQLILIFTEVWLYNFHVSW